MNLTDRNRRLVRLLVGAVTVGAILAPAGLASAQPWPGPGDLTDDLCEPELQDCSDDPDCPEILEAVMPAEDDDCDPEPCPEVLEAVWQSEGEGDDCDPCLVAVALVALGDGEGDDCDPDPCPDAPEEILEAVVRADGDDCDPGTEPPVDPPVPGEPNFTG